MFLSCYASGCVQFHLVVFVFSCFSLFSVILLLFPASGFYAFYFLLLTSLDFQRVYWFDCWLLFGEFVFLCLLLVFLLHFWFVLHIHIQVLLTCFPSLVLLVFALFSFCCLILLVCLIVILCEMFFLVVAFHYFAVLGSFGSVWFWLRLSFFFLLAHLVAQLGVLNNDAVMQHSIFLFLVRCHLDMISGIISKTLQNRVSDIFWPWYMTTKHGKTLS